MIRVADNDNAADSVGVHDGDDIAQVFVSVARRVFKQDIVRRYALLERVSAPHFGFGHESFFGCAAGENDFADPMALVERDGMVDALTEHRRRAFVPRRRTQHHRRIGMSVLRQGLQTCPVNLPCAAQKNTAHQQNAQSKAAKQVISQAIAAFKQGNHLQTALSNPISRVGRQCFPTDGRWLRA